jgi:pyruvate ferredoxin oxidoreductase gamma subunit
MPGEMTEIRIHGRGGQGAKSASQLIVEAAMDQGKEIQAFPEYGPERSGAPMVTYSRISDSPIKTYEPVTRPDVVIVIDPTLMGQVDVTAGMGKDGMLLVNTTKGPDEIRKETGFRGRIFTADATGISIRLLGRNLPNTPMLGVLIRAAGVISMESLTKKVKDMFLDKIGAEKTNANIKAIKEAYGLVRS